MTVTNSFAGPTSNLVETYFRLAQATPGAHIWQRGNLRGCTGPFGHPICNFAVGVDLTEADILELGRITTGRDPFHAYVLPGGDDSGLVEQMARIGLSPTYRLIQMAAPALHEMPGLQPIEATTHAARLALAKFMVSQFFLAQPRQFREGIARATARAGGLDLYAVGFQGQIVGSLMLCREGSTLGLYNLCVAEESRNQGWGRNMLDWVRAVAGAEGRTITLQCDERLANWYQRAGFDEIGQITAYTRPIGGVFDTM